MKAEMIGLKDSIRKDKRKIKKQRRGAFFEKNLPGVNKSLIENYNKSIAMTEERIKTLEEMERLASKNIEEIQSLCQRYLKNPIPIIDYSLLT